MRTKVSPHREKKVGGIGLPSKKWQVTSRKKYIEQRKRAKKENGEVEWGIAGGDIALQKQVADGRKKKAKNGKVDEGIR